MMLSKPRLNDCSDLQPMTFVVGDDFMITCTLLKLQIVERTDAQLYRCAISETKGLVRLALSSTGVY